MDKTELLYLVAGCTVMVLLLAGVAYALLEMLRTDCDQEFE
jgi:hypothetical protein